MYDQLQTCPLCGSKNHKSNLIIDDHAYSKESFSLSKCLDCGFLFTNPIPSDLSLYYSENEYISHKTKFKSITDIAYKLVRNYSFKYKYNLIREDLPKGSLLDIGCGTGEFLRYIRKKGWVIAGVEKSDSARTAAEKTLGITIGTDLYNTTTQYDIITLWHVLEHLPQLSNVMEKLRSSIKPTGYIFFALPNHTSFDADHYKEYWAGYDVPRHLYHFNQETFQKLMTKNGMKVVSTLPLFFDSYYVSLLSEKYQGNSGAKAVISAFQNGYKSNNLARTSMNYSSLIYKCKIK
jgi:SAM-dependent methyltransferase